MKYSNFLKILLILVISQTLISCSTGVDEESNNDTSSEILFFLV